MALDRDDDGAFFGDAVKGLVAQLLKEPDQAHDQHRVIPTGLRDLDELLAGGLRTGQISVLTGASGVGTSTLGLTLARSAAIHQRVRTMIYAPETPIKEIGLRILAAETSVWHASLRSGRLTDHERDLVRTRKRRVADAPLSVMAGHLGVPKAETVHDTVQFWADEPLLRLIVIDGISCAGDLRRVLPGLASAARTHHLALVLTCNERALPSLIDSVDLVVQLHAPDLGESKLEVIKHRYGPTGTVRVGVQSHYGRYCDLPTD